MRRWLGVMLLGLGGCLYSFDNPVETAASGTLSGQVVLVDPAPDQTVTTGRVKVLWSGGLAVPLDATGRFAFLGLPDGVYTVTFDVPPLASNDLPLSGIRPDVRIFVANGQPSAVDLKALSLEAAATLSGTVTRLDGTAVVAAFRPDGGAYEGYEASVAADGTYALRVPAGAHDLVASTATSSATQTVDVAPGERRTLALALAPASGGAQVTGQIVFGGPGLGATSAAPSAFTSGIAFSATSNGAAGASGMVTVAQSGASSNAQVAAGQSGGQVVDLTLTLPTQAAAGLANGPGGQTEGPYGPLTLPQLPLIAGRDTDLGQITWLPLATLALNGVGDGG